MNGSLLLFVSGCLQKHCKQISISADSIFSVEKTTDQCPNVSTISSEAVLCSVSDRSPEFHVYLDIYLWIECLCELILFIQKIG